MHFKYILDFFFYSIFEKCPHFWTQLFVIIRENDAVVNQYSCRRPRDIISDLNYLFIFILKGTL